MHDVLDGCDKVYGMIMLIRSMSPQVIITDEMGKQEDIRAVWQCKNAGVSLITSIHGSSRKDIEDSPLGQLLEKKVFKNIIYLSGEKCTRHRKGDTKCLRYWVFWGSLQHAGWQAY